MNKRRNPRLSGNARALRRNMTPEEKHLWYDFLCTLPYTVHRQKVIGPYIVDFYIAQHNIVIELDGSQHGEGAQLQKDTARDAYLSAAGYTVLRYANERVHRGFRDVCDDICFHLSLT